MSSCEKIEEIENKKSNFFLKTKHFLISLNNNKKLQQNTTHIFFSIKKNIEETLNKLNQIYYHKKCLQ